MIKAILIDDEDDARLTLRSFLKSYCPDVSIIGEANGVESAYLSIRTLNPDMIFLDIQMEDGTGFDLLEKLKHITFPVIFTTAFDSFAIKAFKYSAIDYLLKPIDPDELIDAIAKVRRQFNQNNVKVDQLLKFQKGEQQDRMTISSSEGLTIVKLEDIIRLESDSNYTHFFLKGGEKITVPKSLKEYEDILPEDRFFRIHQSHIVNLRYVKKYIKEDGGYVLMEDGSQAYVARRRKDEFLQILTGQ
jgi:two-component system, LytTR family, response regulator